MSNNMDKSLLDAELKLNAFCSHQQGSGRILA